MTAPHMTPEEHYKQAEDLLTGAWEETDTTHREHLFAAAQVHATLAQSPLYPTRFVMPAAPDEETKKQLLAAANRLTVAPDAQTGHVSIMRSIYTPTGVRALPLGSIVADQSGAVAVLRKGASGATHVEIAGVEDWQPLDRLRFPVTVHHVGKDG